MAFAWSKKAEAFFCGQFHVDAHSICQITNLLYDFRSGAGDGFGMDIASEMILISEKEKSTIHQFHGIGRTLYNSGA